MTAFPADGINPVYPTSYLDVTSVPGPGGITLGFNQALTHDIAGALATGWATWSHGYAGDVYDTISANDPYSVTLTLPGGTVAFYLYAEPTAFATYRITATEASGSSISTDVNGNGGAFGFGFYADPASFLTSIRIDGTSATEPSTDFAIGEFGICCNVVPEPSTVIAGALMILPFGLQGIRCLRNRKQVCAK